jgi:hypothetical protein
MKKMTTTGLARRIKNGLRRLGLRLGLGQGYYAFASGACCAIGGALAYAAKDVDDLRRIVSEINGLGGDNPVWHAQSAKILNHGLTKKDMLMLEAGFEDYCLERGFPMFPERFSLERNPFYRLGVRLRKDAAGTFSTTAT